MRYSLYPKGLKVKIFPYLCGAGEGHFIYIHVGRDGSSCSGPIARDDVHHTWWESSLPFTTGKSDVIPFTNQGFHLPLSVSKASAGLPQRMEPLLLQFNFPDI